MEHLCSRNGRQRGLYRHLLTMSLLQEPAVIAAIVTVVLTGAMSAIRYAFNIQFLRIGQVEEKIEESDKEIGTKFDELGERLDKQNEQLSNIEDLILGGEYQVSDGMLELVEVNNEDIEDHEDRIEGVERIQLKIRRRQKEHSGGEPVAHGEDLEPPPKMEDEDSD